MADYDILQVQRSVRARKGQEEVGFGNNQMHIDIIAAVQLYSVVK